MSVKDNRDIHQGSKSIERSDFALRVNYKNDLPEMPFDTKSIPYSFDTSKFYKYNTTSLEKEYQYELFADDDLGVYSSLINIDFCKVNSSSGVKLNPKDELLLNDDASADPEAVGKSLKRSKPVSWLRRTGFIIPSINTSNRSKALLETKVGACMDADILCRNLYKTREAQIIAIEKSFEDAKLPITSHPSNKSLKPVEVFNIFPDTELWKHTFSHITFDAAPTVQGKGDPISEESLKDALLKGMSDELGEYVAYFVKAQNNKNSVFSENSHQGSVMYEMVREYNWTIQNISLGASEDVYFLRISKNNEALYNEVSARVKLTKRRLPGGQLKNNECNTLLVLKPRENTAEEENEQMKRELALVPANLSQHDDDNDSRIEPFLSSVKGEVSNQGDPDADPITSDLNMDNSSPDGSSSQAP